MLLSPLSSRQRRTEEHTLPMTRGENAAHFDAALTGLVIESLTVAGPDVVREAQHWTTGGRGPVVEDPDQLAGADLSAFATEAVLLGARVLATTAQTSEARLLEQMLKEVGEKTEAASSKAAESTELAVKDASAAVVQVANDANKAITDTDQQSRKEFT